ncbi:helix-turn-helix domain-containing protein [Chloroflexales bacterium ZM16-3]|nr:helix-turn-helix domain-containing protein [Chloroflexales bacterium ZM16-3]
MHAVGIYLRSLRDAAKLTQVEAAERVGLTAKTVERWEAGRHEPKLTELAEYVLSIGGDVGRTVALLLDTRDAPAGPSDDALASLNPENKRLVLELIDQLRKSP